MYRHTFAEIDLAAIRHNFLLLKELNPTGQFFCPMVKSNAYGHGDLEVVSALREAGAQAVGVALIEEALFLRSNGVKDLDIIVFGGFNAEGARTIREAGLTSVIFLPEQLKILETEFSSREEIPIHLKINTGMNRLGLSKSELQEAKSWLKSKSQFDIRGLCTHLACGEDIGLESHSLEQLKNFESMIADFDQSIPRHAFNSAALISSWAHQTSVHQYGSRPGLSIYGVFPEIYFADESAKNRALDLDLRPAMSLRSQVVQFQKVKAGESVSYGFAWQAERNSVVATVAIGYADGYQRHFSNQGSMLFRGQKVPVVGRVCMDYTLIDVTDVSLKTPLKVGESVTVFGHEGSVSLGKNLASNQDMSSVHSVVDAAMEAQTISYELLTSIGRRVPRIFKPKKG